MHWGRGLCAIGPHKYMFKALSRARAVPPVLFGILMIMLIDFIQFYADLATVPFRSFNADSGSALLKAGKSGRPHKSEQFGSYVSYSVIH